MASCCFEVHSQPTLIVAIALKVQNNRFFAHTENILLDMLDEDEDLQRMAVNKLCSLRSKAPSYAIENDNFEAGSIEPSSVSTECTAI